MSSSTVRWGLLGASTIAREWMAPAIKSAKGHEIVALHSRSSERGSAFASEFGIDTVCTDCAEFLALPQVDAVYISTTNDLHEAQALAAAKAGKHVLCEKPLALSVAGARRMVDACAAAGVVIGTNHHFRNSAWIRAAREAITEGVIGRPLAARIAQAFLLPEELWGWRLNAADQGAGVILDLTVHTADTLRFALDAEVEAVSAMSSANTLGEGDIEDAVLGTMQLSNGVLASFYDAFNVANGSTALEIFGSEGSIFIENALDEHLTATATVKRGHKEEPLPTSEPENLYVFGLRRFAEAMAGSGRPAASGEDGARSLAVATAVLESVNSGVQIRVSWPEGDSE